MVRLLGLHWPKLYKSKYHHQYSGPSCAVKTTNQIVEEFCQRPPAWKLYCAGCPVFSLWVFLRMEKHGTHWSTTTFNNTGALKRLATITTAIANYKTKQFAKRPKSAAKCLSPENIPGTAEFSVEQIQIISGGSEVLFPDTISLPTD